jgi:toxin-antitoxin system PIN domain toxin
MKLPDVNIWLALTLSGHSHHQAARIWLEGQDDHSSICFCRATQQGLVRLLTTAAVLAAYGIPPLANREAWSVLESFMADDRIAFANEPAGVEESWKELAALRDTNSPKLWMDAWLAAFARCSGFQLITADKAFSQFEGIDLHLVTAGEPRNDP